MDSPGTTNNESYFPDNTTDEDIFNMLVEGKLKCICENCSTLNIVQPIPLTFTCKGCNEEVWIATMNKKYFKPED